MNIIDIAKLAVLVVLFLSSVVICRPIVDFSSSSAADFDDNNAIGLNAIELPPYPAAAASVLSPYRMEFSHQRVKKNNNGGVRHQKKKGKSRMVCPPAAVEAADEKSHWIRNTCFGGFVTVVSDGSGRHRSRAVARLEGISKYDTEAAFVKETCYDVDAGPLSSEVITRLYHAKSRRYICFNKKGKIRTVTRRRAEKMGAQCMFREHYAVESKGKQTVQYVSLHRPEWLLGFNGRKRRLEQTTPEGDKIALARSFSSGKRVTEDRCDFLFSTGEYTERDVRDDWGGLFDLIENHVEVEEDEEDITTRTASRSGGLGSSGGKTKKDKEATSAAGGLGGGDGRVTGDIGSALDAVVELAEDLLHNDKKTQDDESVEEPMQSRAGSIPKDWESDFESSKEEEERISTHSRRRIRRHRRRRRQRNEGNLPTSHVARKKDNLPATNLQTAGSPPSGRSDSGRSPAGRRLRRRRHGTRKRLRDSPDSRLREGASRR